MVSQLTNKASSMPAQEGFQPEDSRLYSLSHLKKKSFKFQQLKPLPPGFLSIINTALLSVNSYLVLTPY